MVRISHICVPWTFAHHIWLYLIIFIFSQCGDIEKKSGSKQNSCQTFPICYWDLSNILAHNFLKLFILQTYITVYNFDIICLSETYLDSSILPDHHNLKTQIYNLFREDHHLNNKRGGICIYYKIYLPLNIKKIHYLKERIDFEITITGKVCIFITFLYHSPNHKDNFVSFLNNFKINLDSIMVNVWLLFLVILMRNRVSGPITI